MQLEDGTKERRKTMSKEKILEYFSDINYAYNDCTRLETLKNMLNELEDVVRCKDCKHSQVQGHWRYCKFDRHDGIELDSDWFCADGKRINDAESI